MSGSIDATDPRPHSVYHCLDETGALLYVGCAVDPPRRMWHHTHKCNERKQPNLFLRYLMTECFWYDYATKAEARQVERATIRTEAPLLNKQHNPSRFRRDMATGGYRFAGRPHAITWGAFPDLHVHYDAEMRAELDELFAFTLSTLEVCDFEPRLPDEPLTSPMFFDYGIEAAA